MAGEQATYKVLVASSGVTNIVSHRIYGGGLAPEDADPPYITYQVVGDADRQPNIKGATGVVAKRVQVNCVSASYTQCTQIADKARVALHCYYGTGGAETVHGIFMENEIDVQVPRVEGSDTYIFIKVQDYVVWVNEATS